MSGTIVLGENFQTIDNQRKQCANILTAFFFFFKENIEIIERINRTLINKVRSIIFHANLPIYL